MNTQLEASILELTQRLVSLPSRAGIDDYGPVFSLLAGWLGDRGIPCRQLAGADGRPIVLVAEVAGGPGPHYWLNTTIDTAGFGDEAAWSLPPTAALVRDGWLYGRGSADSKAGAAIFCHVAAELFARRSSLAGTLKLVFDGDEHTGTFAGIERALASEGREHLAGVYLGYPGFDKLGIGGRGFERATIAVHGQAAHSGSSSRRGVNAVSAAARLVQLLEAQPLPAADRNDQADGGFPLPPALTVTGLSGGHGFSEVPDLCELRVDLRLTPRFGRAEARALVAAAVARLPAERLPGGGAAHAEIAWIPGWPAYHLPPHSRLAGALFDAAAAILPRPLQPAVVGPSNIANLLAQQGIEATCGFGVAYRNAHATDEAIEIATLLPVYQVYLRAVEVLLSKT